MGRFIAFLYGLVAYVVFFVTFLYAIGFAGLNPCNGALLENSLWPKATAPVTAAGIIGAIYEINRDHGSFSCA